MEINQISIFPELIQINKELNNNNNKTTFPNVTLSAGLNMKQLSIDFMLIHRILQKRSKTIKKLAYILLNEMKIKSGKLDVVTLTRDSLIYYYLF